LEPPRNSHTAESRSTSIGSRCSSSEDEEDVIRVGTVLRLDDDTGHIATQGSDLVVLSDYLSLPVDSRGIRLSMASQGHQDGRRSRCRKCAFYNSYAVRKGKSCRHGALCDFCHQEHSRFIHRR
jgi:hypothetical protein